MKVLTKRAKDITKLLEVEDILKNKPPLVVSTEIDELKNNLEDILKSSGLEAIVICNQHSDNCGCHEDYRKAA